MKKRFVTTLLSLIACIACVIGFAACGDKADSVAGKSYEFEKVVIESGAEGAVKDTAEAQLNQLYAGSTLTFDNDGNYTLTMMGVPMKDTYTQSGAIVTLNQGNEKQDVTVSGDKLVLTIETEGIKASLTYKLATNESGEKEEEEEGEEGEEGEQGEGGGEISSKDVLAGKTYVMTDYLMNGQSVFQMVSEQLGEMKIVFNQNGGFTMSTGTGNNATGTYTISNSTVTLTVQGEPQEFTIAANTLTATSTEDMGDGTTSTLTMIFTLQA